MTILPPWQRFLNRFKPRLGISWKPKSGSIWSMPARGGRAPAACQCAHVRKIARGYEMCAADRAALAAGGGQRSTREDAERLAAWCTVRRVTATQVRRHAGAQLLALGAELKRAWAPGPARASTREGEEDLSWMRSRVSMSKLVAVLCRAIAALDEVGIAGKAQAQHYAPQRQSLAPAGMPRAAGDSMGK